MFESGKLGDENHHVVSVEKLWRFTVVTFYTFLTEEWKNSFDLKEFSVREENHSLTVMYMSSRGAEVLSVRSSSRGSFNVTTLCVFFCIDFSL